MNTNVRLKETITKRTCSNMSLDQTTETGVYVNKLIDGDKIEKVYKEGNDHCTVPTKLAERIILSLTRPSYVLGLGTRNVRTENRSRLERLLRKLVRQHNWKEASGVLSMLLKGTCRINSPEQNHYKYWVAMELLKLLKGKNVSSVKIKHIYELWMRKIGSMKKQPLEDRFKVQVEYIMFFLQLGNLEEAHQAAICLMQEREFGRDGYSNVVVGLVYYQLWYSTVPKEMQLEDVERSHCDTDTQSDVSRGKFNYLVENSNGSYAVDRQSVDSLCDSDTSVRIDKIIAEHSIGRSGKGASVSIDVSLEAEELQPSFNPQSFYMSSADNENEEVSLEIYGDNMEHTSVFSLHGRLDPWLFPIQLPHLHYTVEDFAYLQRELINDYYKPAVKYLYLALESTPPVLEALSPLVQLLMVGERVKEALCMLEKFCQNGNTSLPFRLRARILELFDRNDSSLISSCYEEMLRNDPICSYSLKRLVSMHQNGDYSPESLSEMIALHLDATYGEFSTWKEFALCLHKLSRDEQDQMSVCLDGNESGLNQSYSIRYNRIPNVFLDVQSAKGWMFRCKWWLRRHFSKNILLSEISARSLQLLTYKAACACHLYGNQIEYVLMATTFLEKENRDMLLSLQAHMQISVGFYLTFAPTS